jgi:hypothetical protein
MKTPFTIRVEQQDMELWQRAANLSGMSISEWARRGLTAFAEGRVNGRHSQDVREARAVPVVERGTGAGRRPADIDGPVHPAAVSPVDQEVARRTGHPIGCDCFQCNQTRRFVGQPDKPKAPEKKKGKRR